MSLMKLARSEHVQSLTVEWSLILRLIDRASPFLSEHSLGSLHITVPDGQDVIDSLPGDSVVFHGDCRSNRVHLRLDAVATLSCLNEDLIGVKHEMRIGENPVLIDHDPAFRDLDRILLGPRPHGIGQPHLAEDIDNGIHSACSPGLHTLRRRQDRKKLASQIITFLMDVAPACESDQYRQNVVLSTTFLRSKRQNLTWRSRCP
jgi:hypothetical protein